MGGGDKNTNATTKQTPFAAQKNIKKKYKNNTASIFSLHSFFSNATNLFFSDFSAFSAFTVAFVHFFSPHTITAL